MVTPKFIKVNEGLHEHLPGFPPVAFKVYLAVLFHTHTKSGTEGKVKITNKQLQDETGHSADAVADALKWLRSPIHPLADGRVRDPYLAVEGFARSQVITVAKFKEPYYVAMRRNAKRERERQRELEAQANPDGYSYHDEATIIANDTSDDDLPFD